MNVSLMRATLVALIGLTLDRASGRVPAQTGDPHRPAFIELYTSQGCSSCPPADAVLGELAQMPNVVALAFHVAYWDHIGWADRFALPIAVERQARYVDRLGLSSAFTPQAIVDGHSSVVGADKPRIVAALREARETIPVELELRPGELLVTIPGLAGHTSCEVHLAAYLPEAQTRVRNGENSGRTLTEFNIVRQFRTLGSWDGHEAVFRVPLAELPTDATRAAVLLQHTGQGPIAGGATVALR